MPTSYSVFKPEIKQWFLENIPTHKRILDVGPGEGTYSNLLRSSGYRIDAVEIYEPYLNQYNLRDKYDNVYIDDILNFDTRDYDVIILGDVLEHIMPLYAQLLINRINNAGQQCLVAVPYLMHQGEYEGNIYEAHKQEDLTHEVMNDRYPNLVCLYENEHYGYYVLPDDRLEKAFVMYATESYVNTVQGAVNSIRKFSNIPITVYLLDYYADIEGATAIPWECDIDNINQEEFINRTNSRLYPMMIQRPEIVKHALKHYAKTVAYIDADSVATSNIDKIFELAKDSREVPYFVEGIYNHLYSNGRGDLETPACRLFNVPPDNRLFYRQSGYFVATQHAVPFLDQWSWMCNHPSILRNPQWYAPFHEETILNVLLWKSNIQQGLPLIYMNVRGDNFDKVTKDLQWGKETEMWIKYPDKKEYLLFYHGEKDIIKMNQMTEKIRDNVTKLKNVKIVEGYPNYSIDTKGIVINVNTSNEIKSYLNQGRWMVELWKDNTKKHYHIHRLLAENFIPNPEDKPQVNHIDGNPQNNNLDNLEWVTDRENKLHAYRTGLKVAIGKTVIQSTKSGKLIGEYKSISDASKATGIDRKGIGMNIKGLRNYGGGYIWDLKEDSKNKIMTKKLKIMFLASHLSTGGMPAFLLKRIEALQAHSNVEIYVVEWEYISPDFVVQRNKIIELVKNFYSLGEDKNELMKIIKTNQIDVVHIDEMVEHLAHCSFDLKLQLYAPDRKYRIVETCHNVIFKPDVEKKFHPDAYAFCTTWHISIFQNMPSYKEVMQFPIENNTSLIWDKGIAKNKLGMLKGKKHVLNVGLWTKGKNQGEGLEIARKYPNMQFHFVGNRAGNFKDYWEPLMKNVPSNVTIWDERTDVELFYQAADIFMFNSTFECSPLALREAIGYGLPIIARDLLEYEDMFTPYLQPIYTDLNTIERNYDIPLDNTIENFANSHIKFYNEVMEFPIVLTATAPSKINITQHFVNKPHLEITGDSSSTYVIKFFNEAGECYYDHTTTVNHWVELNRTYFTKWNAKVWEDGILIYDNTLDFKDQKILIGFESSALGDTLAWIPYCQVFQEKHQCELFVSTFHNHLFKSAYPDITFVEPGSTVNNLMGMYHIGSNDDHNPNTEPENTIVIPLQKVACNILGLEYKETRPKVKSNRGVSVFRKKYVTIATNSTAGLKFWQKEDWQKVINYLVEKDYLVVNVSKEKNEFINCTQISDDSISNTMNVIHYSEFFIGLSSGLSWLAWAMNKEVIMIANFTNKDYEFSCHRLVNTSVCHGCFNNPNFKFDKGDWNFCPINKGTIDQWVCQRSISPGMVIEKIKELL